MIRLRRKRRGTLHLLAGLMVLSAVLRLAPGASLAMAEDVEPAATSETDESPDESLGLANSALIDALQDRETALALREAQIADRMQALRVAEAEVADQLAALETAEQALRQTMAEVESASQTDLARLATVYENMKPREAAPLFAQMPPGFAAGFLGLMAPEAAAPIMAELPPDVAYSISVMLAGRNANAPTE